MSYDSLNIGVDLVEERRLTRRQRRQMELAAAEEGNRTLGAAPGEEEAIPAPSGDAERPGGRPSTYGPMTPYMTVGPWIPADVRQDTIFEPSRRTTGTNVYKGSRQTRHAPRASWGRATRGVRRFPRRRDVHHARVSRRRWRFTSRGATDTARRTRCPSTIPCAPWAGGWPTTQTRTSVCGFKSSDKKWKTWG